LNSMGLDGDEVLGFVPKIADELNKLIHHTLCI